MPITAAPRLPWPLLPLWFWALLFWAAPVWAQTPSVQDDLRVLAQTRLPAQALLIQGAELTYGQALSRLSGPVTDGRLLAFGELLGGRQDYAATGRTRTDGAGLLVGLGQVFLVDDSPLARFTYGVFSEGGAGDFEISRAYAAAGAQRGSGRADYFGGGLLFKAEFHNQAYLDGSFRLGRVRSSLDSLDLWHLPLDRPKFSSSYLGAVGGLGYLWSLQDRLRLDVYARLRWTHQSGAAWSSGPLNFKFEPLNATQTILGARADWRLTPEVKVYLDAAWEREFNGRQDVVGATAGGDFMDRPPDLIGDSFRTGLGLEAAAAEGFSARLGLGGAWGGREALTASLRLQYEF